MGTETKYNCHLIIFNIIIVKLNNPQMGTETEKHGLKHS